MQIESSGHMQTCSMKSLRRICCTPCNADATAYAYLCFKEKMETHQNSYQKTKEQSPSTDRT